MQCWGQVLLTYNQSTTERNEPRAFCGAIRAKVMRSSSHSAPTDRVPSVFPHLLSGFHQPAPAAVGGSAQVFSRFTRGDCLAVAVAVHDSPWRGRRSQMTIPTYLYHIILYDVYYYMLLYITIHNKIYYYILLYIIYYYITLYYVIC